MIRERRKEVSLRTAVTSAHSRPAREGARPFWAWARFAGGAGVLAVVVWRVGTGPFLDGVRALDRATLATAFGIGVLTTVCCAWRWSLVAAGLGTRLPLGRAVVAYYRSQFLNVTLPGGVLGDVHRAVRHGLDISDVGLAARAVVLERLAGTLVLAVVAVATLSTLPSPVRSYMPLAAIVVAIAVLLTAFTSHRLMGAGLIAGRRWAGIVLASCVVPAGHLATFLLAARTAGATAPLKLLLPLTLLALLAMALPVNVAGWGPREGVAAWAFGAAGMTATQGVTSAVAYGVLALAASLPGGVFLLHGLKRDPVPIE
jgi:glycosyltransferase 2 family protein